MAAALSSARPEPAARRARLVRDYRCADCGYGVAPRLGLPTRCPMCGSARWTAVGGRVRRPWAA